MIWVYVLLAWLLLMQVLQEGVSQVWDGVLAGYLLLLCEVLGLRLRVTSFRVLAKVGIAAL